MIHITELQGMLMIYISVFGFIVISALITLTNEKINSPKKLLLTQLGILVVSFITYLVTRGLGLVH